jgi:hypothetical protein
VFDAPSDCSYDCVGGVRGELGELLSVPSGGTTTIGGETAMLGDGTDHTSGGAASTFHALLCGHWIKDN